MSWEEVGEYWGSAGATKRDAERLKLQKEADSKAADAALNQQKAVELGMQNTFNREALEPIVAELQALKSKDIYNRTAQVVDASLKDGKYEDAWNSFLSDPSVKGLYQGMNVQSVQTFNPANEAHVRAYRQSGMPEEVLNYLLKGADTNIVPANENGQVVLNEQKVTPEDLKAIAMAYPLVQGLDNSIRVQPLGDFMASTGILKGVLSATDKQRYFDVVDQGINTLGKVAQGAYKAKLAKEQAEKEKLLAEASETTQKAEGLKYDNQIKEKILSGDGTAESKAMEILKLTDPKTYAMLQKSQVELQTAEVGLETAKAKLVETGKNIELKGLEIGEKKEARTEKILDKQAEVGNLDVGIQQVDTAIKSLDKNFDSATGKWLASYLPDAEAAALKKKLTTLDAKGFLASISQMKGMGALSDAEGQKISAAITNLTVDQKTPELRDNLNILRNFLVQRKEFLNRKLSTNQQAQKTSGTQPTGYTSRTGQFFPEGSRHGNFVIKNGIPVKVNK